MSTYWQFRCKHCFETNWHDSNHAEGRLRLLLRNHRILKNLIICAHVLTEEACDSCWSWDTTISTDGSLPIDLRAFKEDCDHVFEAVSEYGHIIGEDGVCHEPPHWEKK